MCKESNLPCKWGNRSKRRDRAVASNGRVYKDYDTKYIWNGI